MRLSRTKFLPFAVGLLLPFSVFSQGVPADFRKAADSLIEAGPRTYKEINDVLRPNRRDTVLMKYFVKEATKSNYLDGLAYAYNQFGTRYRNLSDFSRAIEYHQMGLDAAVEADNTEFRIFSLNMLGVVYRRMDAIKTALDYSQEALELAETIESPSEGIKRSINVSHNSIGNIYQTLRQCDLAIEQFKKSMELEAELNNTRGLAVNSQNIGECLEEQGKLDEALKYFRQALAYDEEINSDPGKAICKNSIAQIYIKQNRLVDALSILEPTLLSAEKTGDKQIIVSVLINLGWALMELKRFDEAEDHLRQGLDMARKHNLPRFISRSYDLLSELANYRGEYKSALDYFKKAEEFDEMVTNDLNLSYVNDVIIRYDTEKKNNQIEALAKQNEIVRLKLRRNQNTLLVSALLLALFTLILYILYRQYQLKSEKKMLTLEQSMLRSQMNPHFLFNSLNSIKLYIINNEKKNAVHYLNKFSKLVRKILEASSLKEIPLAEELETVELYMNIENIRFSNEIQFEIKVDEGIDPHIIKIPSLILQPFLENALWHGLSSKEGEKRILLRVAHEKKGFISISIEDNGVGREAAERLKASKVLKRKSVGIDITKERLANFSKDYQNSFDVTIEDLFCDDGRAAGTRVNLSIPTI
ncbi:tetratricopeptide repeat-containing sensor histidine kinase [Poritiphilus flavus]|uniref:Tetratricopeptide repeat protein n=1 Tax=Poritiphilus flavus TaxID=2697053 RepID=A0A6L9E8Q1_9FLAO|nr:tetratricopeptide repeat protein [Poritiphilus flavus]NAS10829.1 tetratricopeptide repeat protein [Poritiphilus flavus]